MKYIVGTVLLTKLRKMLFFKIYLQLYIQATKYVIIIFYLFGLAGFVFFGSFIYNMLHIDARVSTILSTSDVPTKNIPANKTGIVQ